ncbi:MAG: hypothetical protein LBR52_01975 [Prevotellaceae bacterium]|jgi:RHS repeat-associated protein|nr:hypothetical protein [Prevotellaceae bacterium]
MKKYILISSLLFGLFAPIYGQKSYTLNTPDTESKEYVARDFIRFLPGYSFTAGEGKSLVARIDNTMLSIPSEDTYLKPDGTTTSDPSQGAAVGSITGTMNVSPTGAAIYQIPIEIPAGINGVQPNVQLMYNSQAGNGVAGMGFTVSGTSTITRTGSNLYNDGKMDGIRLTNEDNLILDGKRLVLVAGSNLENGAKYRTQEETYSDITYKNINGFLCFEVVTQAGITMTYGASADSYIEAQGISVPLTWALTKTVDSNGNFITYEYGENNENGEFWLSKIRYTGNASASTEPMHEIEFTYNSDRPDAQLSYVSGTKTMLTKLLETIKVKTNGQTLKEYACSYDFDGFYSKLSAIHLTNSEGEKYSPTVLNWNKLNEENPPVNAIVSHASIPQDDCYEYTALVDDFNNDGISDFIKTCTNMATGGSSIGGHISDWKLYLSNKTDGNISYSMSQETSLGYYGVCTLLSLDLNSDGTKDLVEIKNYTGNNPYYKIDFLLNDGSGVLDRQYFETYFETSSSSLYHDRTIQFECNDFNGDGNIEMLAIHGDNVKMYRINFETKELTELSSTVNESFYSNAGYNHSITDVNGNGLLEIYNRTGGEIFEYNSSTNSFEQINFSNAAFYLDNMHGSGDFVDINGDGKTDLIVYYSAYQVQTPTWYIKLSTGTSFIDIPCPLTRTRTMTYDGDEFTDNYFYADYNNDGKTDILEMSSDGITLYCYTGNRFVSKSYAADEIPTSLNNSLYYNKLIPYHDMTGDGKCDLLSLSDDGIYVHSFTTPETEKQLASVTDGLGRTTTITYKPLSDGTVYEGGSPEVSSQVAQFCVPFPVVAQVNFSAGDFTNTTNYSYKGLRCHLKGKGMLGFEEFIEDNITHNRKKITKFGYDTNFFNIYPVEEKVLTSNENNPIVTNTYEAGIEKLGLDIHKRYFPYTSKKTITDHLTGQTIIIETSGYEDGNPLLITTTQGDIVETKTMQYIQKGSWCKNRLSDIITTKTVNGETYVRQISSTYDNKGNLTKETIDPGDENEFITEYKNFDLFGQARLVERKANGITRSSSYTYSPSGRFMTGKTDELGQTTTYEWNENSGLLDSKTDRLGTVQFSYNGFGELIETQYADGIRKAEVLRWANPNNTLGAKYYSYVEKSGSSPVITWFNAFGKEILKETFGLNEQKVSVFTEYYPDGNKKRISEPTFTSSPESWAATYTYDKYGRPETLTTPMGVTSTEYGTVTATITSPEGTKTTTYNSSGQVVSVETNGKSVNYLYYPSGQIKTTTPEGGVAIRLEYDLQGRRTKLIDPDGGTVESKYNGFGELLWEKQKVHNENEFVTTTNNYAGNGLLQSTEQNGKTTVYTYDSDNRILSIEIAGKHKQTYTYDAFDRVTSLKEEFDGKEYSKDKEYDNYGRVKKEIYPSGYYVLNRYDSYGYLVEVSDRYGHSIWKILEENARGQATRIQKGNKETVYEYDERGLTTAIAADGVVDMSYTFDARGNLDSRTDNLTSQQERFEYDVMNRLTNWDIYKNGMLAGENSIRFDSNGNITQKTDLGDCLLNYGENNKPHALTSINGTVNDIPASTLNITYTDFKKVASLAEDDKHYSLFYGVDNQRRKSVYSVNGQVRQTRYYLGNYEEEIDSDGNVRKIHYLAGGSLFIQNNGNDSLLYAYHNFQGSLIALTDEDGTVLEKYAYDPWGVRRNPDDWKERDDRTSWLINRGYTGHEHIDAFGIINMNGRVFDPFTASFLSPDPYIQAPDQWMNYNRYAYAMNNPFMYTDPSGYSWLSQFGEWIASNWKTVVVVAAAVVVGVVVTVCTAGTATPLLVGIYAGAAAGFTGGVVGTALNGGSFMDCLGAGIMGGMVGGIFGGVGAYAATLAPAGALWGSLYGAGTGGVLGGAQSALTGGSFWDGVKMGAAFGFVGGGAQGFSSAKQQGLNPWTGTKLPETTVNTPVAPAAVQNAANEPANTNTAPVETPTVTEPQVPSPKVQEALDALNEIKADGGIVAPPKSGLKPSQEVNIIVKYKGDMLKIRVETHPLKPIYGGDYVTPMRHLNLDLTPTPATPLPNGGHIILPSLK